ncbi:hypothetical protein D3C85_803070 [compost metagenome]
MASSTMARVSASSFISPAGPKLMMFSPSVSITAMSTASSEVPVMKPSTRRVFVEEEVVMAG